MHVHKRFALSTAQRKDPYGSSHKNAFLGRQQPSMGFGIFSGGLTSAVSAALR